MYTVFRYTHNHTRLVYWTGEFNHLDDPRQTCHWAEARHFKTARDGYNACRGVRRLQYWKVGKK